MRLSPVLALAALASLATACAAAGTAEPTGETKGASSEAIVGGTAANIASWPGIVQLANADGPFCGGTLVAPQWVLTASHCIDPSKGTNGGVEKVVIGRQSSNDTASGEEIAVTESIQHEGFSLATMLDDIALVHLAKSTTRARAQIMTEAQWNAVAKTGLTTTVVGWGATQEGGQMSTTLNQVSVPLTSHASCVASYAAQSPSVGDNMICAGLNEGEKDSCQGDSGGPLFVTLGGKPFQVGIVSFGQGCAQPGFPGVYTKLPAYLDWLSEKTGGAIAPVTAVSTATNEGSDTEGGSDSGDVADEKSNAASSSTSSSSSRSTAIPSAGACAAAPVRRGEVGGGLLGVALATLAVGRRRRKA